jgi:hypothetical protein
MKRGRNIVGAVETWELVARERIRDSIARYTWGGDHLRLDDVAATFCPDGVLEVRGRPPVRGRDAIKVMLGGVAVDDGTAPPTASIPTTRTGRPLVRHNVTNIRIGPLTPERAEVSSYFTVLTEIGLDHAGRYRDVLVPVGDEWLFEHRFVSTDWWSPHSTMVGSDGHPVRG